MSRTSPFFVPQKEVNLINDMNEELIDEIVGQTVDIYKISVEDTSKLKSFIYSILEDP